jgi:hypothetical protein
MIRREDRVWLRKYQNQGKSKRPRELTGLEQSGPSFSKGDLSKKAVVQQNPVVSPPFPILDIGLEYILGQIGANATTNGNNSVKLSSRHARHFDTRATHIYHGKRASLARRVEGPVQCGPAEPCADGSCCNSVRPFSGCLSWPNRTERMGNADSKLIIANPRRQ